MFLLLGGIMDEVLQKKISEVQNEAAPALIKTALEMEAIKPLSN